MTYSETINYLYSQLPAYHRIGKAAYKSNLDNSLALDEYFGHPHRRFRSVHIAGTNGKGSVSHMLASVLQEAGYRTALYTSPHLKDYRERIRINGEMIPEDEVVAFVENHKELLGKITPSFFEMSVAMAFDYFARGGAEIAVIETGLGGRLDSTNIIMPVLSVITNIGYDHTDLLGDTIPQIAVEKAGIIKNNVPVVIGETSPDTAHIFMGRASAAGSPIFFADRLYRCSLGDTHYPEGSREYLLDDTVRGITLSGITALGGDYQALNIPAVAAAVSVMRPETSISDDHLLAGIRNVKANTGLQGRWQVLGRDPVIICDTGHNSAGLKYVISQLEATPADRLHMIIGFVSDKDLSRILPLLPSRAVYYFTRASVPRALDEKILKMKAEEAGLSGESFATVEAALSSARMNAGINDLIFIGGSTFVVAEAL